MKIERDNHGSGNNFVRRHGDRTGASPSRKSSFPTSSLCSLRWAHSHRRRQGVWRTRPHTACDRANMTDLQRNRLEPNAIQGALSFKSAATNNATTGPKWHIALPMLASRKAGRHIRFYAACQRTAQSATRKGRAHHDQDS
jgi:hypothetical protein